MINAITDHHRHPTSEIDDTAAADNDNDILKMMFPSSALSFSSSDEEQRKSFVVNPLLRIGIDCQDIYPIVQASDSLFVNQCSTKTTKNRDHSQSSNNEKALYLLPYTLHEQLQSKFQGQQNTSKYILLVRILQVSDGTISKKKNFMKRIFGSSNKKKVKPSSSDNDNISSDDGVAKLEICYCLCLKETNEIAFVNRKTYTKKSASSSSSSSNKRIISNSNSNKNKDYTVQNTFTKTTTDSSNNTNMILYDLTTLCANGIQREIINASKQHPIPRRSCSKRINPSPVANQPQRTASSSSSSETTSDAIYQYHQRQNRQRGRISRKNGVYCKNETAEAIQKDLIKQRISDLDERWSGELLPTMASI